MQRIDQLLGNNLKTNNKTTFHGRQQILNKYMQPLLDNAFAHFPRETTVEQQ
jgi:hypothetical protein